MSLLILFPAAEQPSPITSTGAFAQAGTWASSGTLRIPATASFAQSGSWAATSSSIQPIASSATFAQPATWAAEGTHTDMSVTVTASFVQDRMMAGVGGSVQLKIVGYASAEPPQRFLDVTGTLLEKWVP